MRIVSTMIDVYVTNLKNKTSLFVLMWLQELIFHIYKKIMTESIFNT